MPQLECSSKWFQMYCPNAPEKMRIVNDRLVNVIFEEKIIIVCTFSNSGRGKTRNTFYQHEYE